MRRAPVLVASCRATPCLVATCLVAACLAALAGACASSAPPPAAPHAPEPAPPHDPDLAPPLGLRLPDDVRPLGYSLDLTAVPGAARLRGSVAITVRLARPRWTVWLNAEELHVTRALLGGREATFVPGEGGVARVTLPRDAEPVAGDTTLVLDFDAPLSHGGDAVFELVADGRPYLATTFEPISARRAFPCFDEPAFKVPFDLALTVPADMVALANAPEASVRPLPDGMKRVVFARSAPLPTYLFTFAVGPFDVVTAAPIPPSALRATPLPLRGVAVAGRGERLRHQLAQIGPMVAALEAWFAQPYPYPKLDVVALPGYPGAMENAAIVFFEDMFLMIDPAEADLATQRGAATTIVHELAHHWFGNLVTMAWWDDLWLNEAFATWLANPILAAVRPDLDADATRVAQLRRALEADAKASTRKIREPIASADDIFAAFDAITYAKGASVIAMFAAWVGPDAWREGVRAYLARHAFGTATTDDLLAAVASASGKDVAPAFKSFLDHPGAPRVTVRLGAVQDQRLPLTIEVARWRPLGSRADDAAPWQTPVCVAGEGITATCVLVDGARGEASVPIADALTTFVPNAGGVGYYHPIVVPDGAQRAALARPRSAAEGAALAASYAAAFASGDMPVDQVLDALAPLADATEPELARTLIRVLAWIGDNVSGSSAPSDASDFTRASRALFGAAMKRLGWAPAPGEAIEVRLLRAELIAFLVHTARAPDIRREAVRRGRALVSRDGSIDRRGTVVAPELFTTAFGAAIADGDEAFFGRVEAALFASRDPTARDDLLNALAQAEAPALAARVQALALDPRITETEMRRALGGLDEPRTREATLTWFEDNVDALIARMPPFEVGFLPVYFQTVCDVAQRERVARLFASRAAALPGAQQTLAETLELIDLCVARVAAQGAGARAWLHARAKTAPKTR